MTTPESADLQAEFAREVEQGYTHCILEVSSHALAQERVHGCRFAVAIFTNLTHDHLDYHKTMERYQAAKRKLFEKLDAAATAVVNADDPAAAAMLEAARGKRLTFGVTQAAAGRPDAARSGSHLTIEGLDIQAREMRLRLDGTEVRTPLIGRHNAYNIAAAYQCALALGIGPSVIKLGIEAVKVIPGRQEEVVCGQPFRVIVDFAHSPDSLAQIVETYREFTAGRLILVFGCPGDRDPSKRPIMGEIAARLADLAIVTTDDPYYENPEQIIEDVAAGCPARRVNWQAVPDRKAAIEMALGHAGSGDTVLLVGRGHEKYQDFAGEKVPFDDKLVAEGFLTKRP